MYKVGDKWCSRCAKRRDGQYFRCPDCKTQLRTRRRYDMAKAARERNETSLVKT